MAGKADRVGEQLGPYRLTRLLGAGGFGEVYEAEHRLLQQKRAIKLLLERHFHDPKNRERFLREARTLAALEHPNILQVLELGEEGDLFYLVMPFYSRGTLSDMLKQRSAPLPLTDVERYFTQMCAALGYAHAKNIVHLDLKPENILIHEDGRLVLSDFGLAHLIKQGRLEAGTSASWGTPYYMAPEHIRGEPEPRSDLYALGVILYQLLTSQKPFTGKTPEAVILKQIMDPPPALRNARPDAPAALDAVMQTALAKKPEERFQTAAALLMAFRDAISSQAPTLYQSAPAPSTALGRAESAVLPYSLFPPPVVAVAPPIIDRPSPAAGTTLLTLKGHTDDVNSVAWSPDGRSLASASDDGTMRLWNWAKGSHLATLPGNTKQVLAVAWSPDGRHLASADDGGTVRLWDAVGHKPLATLKGHTDWVWAVTWSPDGRRLASASIDETVRLWDAASGSPLAILKGHTGEVNAVAWSPDGRYLASAGMDETVRLWDGASGSPLAILKGPIGAVFAVAWSPDGNLASASEDQTVRLWNVITRRLLATLKGHTSCVNAVAWSPNGLTLASASDDQIVRLWDANTGSILVTMQDHTGDVRSVAWSPDGQRLASASADGTVRVWWVG